MTPGGEGIATQAMNEDNIGLALDVLTAADLVQ
jgi:hypothetical protein